MNQPQASSGTFRRAQPWLGTLVKISADATRRSRWQLTAALDAAFAEISTIHRLMSRQEQGTDLAAIARSGPGEVVAVDPRTVEVLRIALLMRLESKGRFEPDRRARRDGRDCWPEGPAWSVEGIRHLRILRRGDLDLDGIAKGFAVDRAVEILQDRGVSASVNAGGDLRRSGELAEPLQLRSSLAGGTLINVGWLTAGSFAASESWVDDGTRQVLAADGIQDPTQPGRRLGRMTVGVAADTCVSADALTKIVAVAPDEAVPLLQAHRAGAWIFEEWRSEGRLRLCGSATHVQCRAT